MRSPRRPVVLPALLLMAACGEPAAALRVGEVRFSAEQVQHLPAERREEVADLAALSEALREGRLEELVSPLAERRALRERLRWLGPALVGHELGDDELARRYSSDPERELRVRHVLRLADRAAPPAVHEEARRVAEEVRARAAAGEPFEELAAAFSEEPGGDRRGGLLDWGREGSWVEPFWEAAARLETGEVSPVVQTVHGYHVLMLEGERPRSSRSVSRATLLRRTVSAGEAEQALAEWAAAVEGELDPSPPAILQARQALRGERALPDSTVLVRWPGGSYTFHDLQKDLALLEGRERERWLSAPEAAFGEAVVGDARTLMWLSLARREGISLPAADPGDARGRWTGRAARWGQVLGLGGDPRTAPERILAALASPGQEVRIARAELATLRFRLRELYPPSPSSSASE